jgi:hypothetical protein
VLFSAANGHLESQHECKQEQWDNTGQNEQKHQKKKQEKESSKIILHSDMSYLK